MQIFLVAISHNGNVFGKPRVVSVDDEHIKVTPATRAKKTKVIETVGTTVNTYVVYDSVSEMHAQSLIVRGQQANIEGLNYISLGLDAAGATAAAATDVTEYFSEFDTSVATSADGVQLDAATVGKVRIVLNNSAVALEMWPQTGENFLGSADDAAVAQAGKSRKHYFCRTATTWEVADDYTA